MANDVPQDLNWVTAVASCSAKHIFTELRLGIEEDVKEANERVKDRRTFDIRANSDMTMFSVFQVGSMHQEVRFFVGPNFIKIQRAPEDNLMVKFSLNRQGRCRLWINTGEELEQWEVRKMALEKLFFGSFPLSV